MLRPKSLDIILPCHNEAEALQISVPIIRAEALKTGLRVRLIMVDDGSSDDTWPTILHLQTLFSEAVGVKLSRNFGHQSAIRAGLTFADADIVCTMDADLQDDPAILPQMVNLVAAGIDIVFGTRQHRHSDTFLKRNTARLYYRLLRAFGVKVVFDHADYRVMSRRAVDALLSYREANLFLRGVASSIGFRTATVPYFRNARVAGETKYSLPRMISLALSGITSFTNAPLRLISILGLVSSFLSLLLGGWVLFQAIVHPEHVVPGWASILVPTSIFASLQLLCSGIIGEYLARVYTEVKDRPPFVIETILPQQRLHTTEMPRHAPPIAAE